MKNVFIKGFEAILFIGSIASTSFGQVIGPIGQIGDTVAGINLAVGPGAGIASCGPDNVVLEGTELQSGLSRIRVYFRDLHASTSSGSRSARSTCIIRVRESHLAESKLTLAYARVLGASDIGPSTSAKMGISVSSSGSQLALANFAVPQAFGQFRQNLVTSPVSTPCQLHDSSGFFGINVALSMMSSDGSDNSISADRIDLYLKEEPCQ